MANNREEVVQVKKNKVQIDTRKVIAVIFDSDTDDSTLLGTDSFQSFVQSRDSDMQRLGDFIPTNTIFPPWIN